MKTKLFYLFIALFAFNSSGNAQATSCTPGVFNCISLIGPGTPAGNWSDDNFLSTVDGDVYTGVDWQFSAGDIKFRANSCWETACTIPGINVNGWGPVSSSETGWPSGTNVSPVSNGANIQCPGGVWNVTFTLSTNSWSFTPGTPNPVIKLTGTAVSGSPVTMSTINGKQYTLKKVTLVPGTCQFDLQDPPSNTGLVGGTAFPSGTVTGPTDFIPVSTTGIDYDVTFDYLTGNYTFAVATFPQIALVGAAVGGWPNDPQVDSNIMTTTDGVTYTLNNLPMIPGDCVFRTDNDWSVKYGDTPFPTGSGNGANNITVPAGDTGTYNVTLNATTKTYTFSKITYSIVGSGAGGWPNDPQIDANQLSTIDGVNYTIAGLVLTNGEAKFRRNNDWGFGGDWGGDTFPAGTKTGNNIPTVAGTYNLTVNVLTGAYDFGTALAVNSFNALSFKAYPNPTKNSWNITSNDDITSVQVYDILGKAVYAKTSASKEVTVNAAALSKGIYFAKVSTANGSSTVKLVKE